MKNGEGELVFQSGAGSHTASELIGVIEAFIQKDPQAFYRIVIGSDSQAKRQNGHSGCDFVTAIIIHRVGKGAIYFWRKVKQFRRPLLREKIYTETLMSLEVAEKLVPGVRSVLQDIHYDLEIHIDVGPVGPTREMIKEVVGMVSGNGYVAKTKPDSWGASSVADRHA